MKSGRFGITIIGALIILAALLAIVGPKLVEKRPEKLPSSADAGKQAGITAKGVVESAEDVELSSQLKGIITRVLVEEGAQVHKGQLLLEFDQSKIEAQLRQARSGLAAAEARFRESAAGYRSEDILMAQGGKEHAQAIYDQSRDDFERQQRLFEKGAATQVDLNRATERLKIAESDLSGANANLKKNRQGVRSEARDQARADLERARADVQLVESTLRDYQVSAPISGIITERHKDRGEGADIGSPLFRIVNPETFRIRAELEETDIGRVSEGQQVEMTVEAFRNKVFRGKVSKVFPVVHKKTQKSFDPMASFDINTQKIFIRLDEYTGLRNGMTATVRFM
jgi:multidrug resistance efflux pump